MVKVLIVGLSAEKGGIETLFYNIFNYLKNSDIKIDILTFDSRCAYEEDFQNSGAKVYKLPSRRSDIKNYQNKLNSFFKSNDFDYVWINQSSASNITVQKAVKRYTKAKVITHSHGTYFECPNVLVRCVNHFLHKLHQKELNCLTDFKFACSKAAGFWLFGKNDKQQCYVINNGIDKQRFMFNIIDREDIRFNLKVSDSVVIGHVGRFALPKNHPFIIQLFNDYHKNYNSNSKLLLIGDGPDFNNIKKMVNDFDLNNAVIFVGNIENVEQYYSAMDLFILPSFFEGLPISLIEAQCNGLPCLVSDKVTKEANITDLVENISIDDRLSFVQKLNKIVFSTMKRTEYSDIIEKKGYNIQSSANRIESFLKKGKIYE